MPTPKEPSPPKPALRDDGDITRVWTLRAVRSLALNSGTNLRKPSQWRHEPADSYPPMLQADAPLWAMLEHLVRLWLWRLKKKIDPSAR